jgi:hypothetical protein
MQSNNLTDISCLCKLQNLETLYAYDNRLNQASVDVLSNFPNLFILHIAKNGIQDMDISCLTEMTNLWFVALGGNCLKYPDAFEADGWIDTIRDNNAGANLFYDPPCNGTEHTLVVSHVGAGGSVTAPGESTFLYAAGEVVPVVAEADPDSGCGFVRWIGTAVDAGKVADPYSPTTTVTMDASYSLQAQFRPVIHVKQHAPGIMQDGLSWETAYTDLSVALQESPANALIWVATGTYTPGLNSDDSFVLKDGVVLRGGFAGSGDARDIKNNTTTLFGACKRHHVIKASGVSGVILDGFIGGAGWYGDKGGGMLIDSGADCLVTRCSFVDNHADQGGAIAVEDSTLHLANSLLFYNEAETGNGGGIWSHNSSIRVTNCTFSDNYAKVYGGGICNIAGSLDVVNSILWGNTGGNPDLGFLQIIGSAGSTSIRHSCVENSTSSANYNIHADPQLTGDFHLQPTSPCIDAGDDTAAVGDTDLDGNPRIIDDPTVPGPRTVDMGAYEHSE